MLGLSDLRVLALENRAPGNIFVLEPELRSPENPEEHALLWPSGLRPWKHRLQEIPPHDIPLLPSAGHLASVQEDSPSLVAVGVSQVHRDGQRVVLPPRVFTVVGRTGGQSRGRGCCCVNVRLG